MTSSCALNFLTVYTTYLIKQIYKSILKNSKDSTTWMKATLVIYSIKQQQNKLYKKMKERHQKKLDNLKINKRVNDGK